MNYVKTMPPRLSFRKSKLALFGLAFAAYVLTNIRASLSLLSAFALMGQQVYVILSFHGLSLNQKVS